MPDYTTQPNGLKSTSPNAVGQPKTVIAALLVLNTKRFSLVAFCSKESMIVGSALLAKLGNEALCYYKNKQSKVLKELLLVSIDYSAAIYVYKS